MRATKLHISQNNARMKKLLFILLFFPLITGAATNVSDTFYITQGTFGMSITASDGTDCATVEPTTDRFTLERVLPDVAGSVFQDVLYASIGAGVTLSTTTDSAVRYYLRCTNGAHDYFFNLIYLEYGTGYNDNLIGYPNNQREYLYFVPEASTSTVSATSTDSTAVAVIFDTFIIFFTSWFGVVWLLRKRL